MLKEKGIDYAYREYREEPLTEAEIRGVLKKLGLAAKDVQRPIGVAGKRAVLGRPVENLLELA